MSKTHLSLKHAKMQENTPEYATRGVFRRYTKNHLTKYLAAGRTRSAVGSMLWEKLVGPGWSLVVVLF